MNYKIYFSKYNSNLRDFTVTRNNDKLYPWQVTGLTDGEGSFAYSLVKPKLDSNKHSTKIKFNLEFKITQKSHSEGILFELKDYFGCGSNGLHKTKNGLELLIQIKNNMNSKCDVDDNSNI